MGQPDIEPFGSRIYDELRRISGFSLVSTELNYEAIQRLKRADREEVIALFRVKRPEVVAGLRVLDPADAALMLLGELRKKAGQRGLSVIDLIWGLLQGLGTS